MPDLKPWELTDEEIGAIVRHDSHTGGPRAVATAAGKKALERALALCCQVREQASGLAGQGLLIEDAIRREAE